MNTKPETEPHPLDCFGKFLSIWVAVCMIIGSLLGYYIPELVNGLNKVSYANISFPIAILLWFMIYPMTLSVNLENLKYVKNNLTGLILTCIINWLFKPFFMFGLAQLFFNSIYSSVIDTELAKEYIAGAVILGGAPCTAMVLVWSSLSNGNASYTLVQVAVNDFIIFILYSPTLFLLLWSTDIEIPYVSIVLSVVFFVVIPFFAGYITQKLTTKDQLKTIEKKFKPLTIICLLLTLIIIFTYQGSEIGKHFVDIILIAIPLIMQNCITFFITFYIAFKLHLPFDIAAPAAFIASSNFFELGVGVAISAYGLDSGATLVNVVGVLVEVPVMLFLVWIAGKNRSRFPTSDHNEKTEISLSTIDSTN